MKLCIPSFALAAIMASVCALATTADAGDKRCHYQGTCDDAKGCRTCTPTVQCCQKCNDEDFSSCSGVPVPTCDINYTSDGCGEFKVGACNAQGECDNWVATQNSCGSSSSCVQ